MLTGIYLLRFIGTTSVYIGQAIDINRRYSVHLRKLKSGTANYKMQNAYLLYGAPSLEILCECTREDLNKYEEEAFEIFRPELNIATKPDIHLEGPSNGAAKYTEEEITLGFELLLDISYRYKDIAIETGVSEATIRHIANGESHSWLEVKYPEKYAILVGMRGITRQSFSNSAKARGIEYPILVSPEGVEYTVEIISTFAKEHGLDSSSLAKVLKRRPKYKSHKGWKLK